MAEKTRARSGRGKLARPIAVAVALSALLHAPLFPTRLSQWIRDVFHLHLADYDDKPEVVIPVDLDLLGGDGPAAPAPAPTAAPPPDVAPVARGTSDQKVAVRAAAVDAGAPDGGTGEGDGGVAPASKPHDDPDAGAPPVRDPIGAAGAAGRIAAKDPNVQILLAGDVLRKHELGASFGRILGLLQEWQPFLEGSPVDPIRDIDHLLITAPRLRGDSSKMVVILELGLPEAKIRAAVDLLVQRADGHWIDDAPIPAALANVGGGDRIFALIPGKRMLVVLPAEALDELPKLKGAKGFKRSSVGITLSMVTPSRPFQGIFKIPSTLKNMRLAVTPTGDGGADLAIEGEDASADLAKGDAEAITKAFDDVRRVDLLGLASLDIVDHVDFKAEGARIFGRVHVSSRQLKRIAGVAEQGAREASAHAAAGGAPVPDGSATAAPAPAPGGKRIVHEPQ